MHIIRGDSEIAEQCIDIARALPDYFTESGISNLVVDIQKHQSFAAIEGQNVIGFIIIAAKYVHAAEILWIAVKR
jgi:hypothetical protein